MSDKSNDPGENLFYHTFPRRGKSSTMEIDKGCAILASIRDSGLLLTPEIIKWHYTHANGAPPRVEKTLQQRVCFTQLSPRELTQHAQNFGAFSLEFSSETIRRLGAVPVFYLPKAKDEGEWSAEGLGGTMVLQILDAIRVLQRVEILDGRNFAPNFDINLEFTENPALKGKFTLNAEATRSVIDVINFGVAPPAMLKNSLDAMLSFFYPTEDDEYQGVGPLHYYRQREWRICGRIAIRGKQLMSGPTEAQRLALLEIDKDYFLRELDGALGKFPRIDRCLFYPAIGDDRIIELARRLIVPASALDRVREILKPLNRPIEVAALEDLK